jgi:hypothetical protein
MAGLRGLRYAAYIAIDTQAYQAIEHRRLEIRVTASVGVALFDGLTNIEIMAAADLAMYEAKALGRDRFAVYEQPSVTAQEVPSRLAGAEMLRTCLAAAVGETRRLGPQTMPGYRQSPHHARRAIRAPRPQTRRGGSPGDGPPAAADSSRGSGG